MLVVSNNRMEHGAAVIASQVILKAIKEKMDGDFVVLPSSIHEVVCVPYSDVTNLTDMVRMGRMGMMQKCAKKIDYLIALIGIMMFN